MTRESALSMGGHARTICLKNYRNLFLERLRNVRRVRARYGGHQRHPLAAVAAIAMVGGLTAWSATASANEHQKPAAYFVSIGDSYATGDRPGDGAVGSSRDGFAYLLADRVAARDWELTNFGCTGETADAMAFESGCADHARALDGPAYPAAPQAVAAADFIAQHRGNIGLVTIVMGGNDIVGCLDQASARSAQACAEAAIPRITLSLDALLSRIRSVAGDAVPIVGLTYINVFAADSLSPDSADRQRVEFSTILFRSFLNPALAQTYAKYGAQFIDVTALAGGYLPSTDKGVVPGHGTVSATVARVCALSYYCGDGDPHPNQAGHRLIAEEIARRSGL